MEYTRIRSKEQLVKMLETQDSANVEIAGTRTEFYHGGSAPHFCGKIKYDSDEFKVKVRQDSDNTMPLEAAVLRLAARRDSNLFVFIRGQVRKGNVFGADVIDISGIKVKFAGDYEITTGDYEKATHPF